MSKDCEDCDNSWKMWAMLFLAICIYNCVDRYFDYQIQIKETKTEETKNVEKF